MPALPLVFAPNPVFKKKAAPVTQVDTEVRQLVSDMFETLYTENGVGIGANMVGVLKQVIVIDLQENGHKNPVAMINPEVTWASDEKQMFREASLSFPGINAEITRPKEIDVQYLDTEGTKQSRRADGFFAAVIQHEMDYLQGRTFLDHLSKLKKNTLLRKYAKLRRRD